MEDRTRVPCWRDARRARVGEGSRFGIYKCPVRTATITKDDPLRSSSTAASSGTSHSRCHAASANYPQAVPARSPGSLGGAYTIARLCAIIRHAHHLRGIDQIRIADQIHRRNRWPRNRSRRDRGSLVNRRIRFRLDHGPRWAFRGLGHRPEPGAPRSPAHSSEWFRDPGRAGGLVARRSASASCRPTAPAAPATKRLFAFERSLTVAAPL